jgi:hypothetical protein
MNYFDYISPIDKNNILVIGNPPFGKISSIAIKFFNHSAKFSNVIAFIVPRTFRRVSVQNKLNKMFHLIYDEDVSTNPCCFIPKMMVKCCFQIWEKKEIERPYINLETKHDDWIFLPFGKIDKNGQPTPPDGADFAIRAYGGKIGEIPIAFFREPEGRTSHHKRSGWMSPFRAGWGTLKTTCTYSLDRILIVPGLLLGLISYILAVARVANLSTFKDFGIGSSAGTAFVGLSMAGFSAFAIGLIAGCIYDQTGRKISNWNRRLAKIPFFGLTIMSSFTLLVQTVLTIDSWISFIGHGRGGEFTATQSWIFSLGTLFNLFIFSATHLLIIYLGKNRTQFVNGA